MTDLLAYYRTYSKHRDIWSCLLLLWNQATKIYSEKVTAIKFDVINQLLPSGHDTSLTSISFNHFLTVAEDFRRKRIGLYFKLQNMNGQLSLNQLLRFTYQFIHRVATDSSVKATGVKQARLMVLLDKIQTNYESGLDTIKLIGKNIDFANVRINASLDAGPHGKLQLILRDILAQMPVIMGLLLSKEKNLGHPPLVPYIINFNPQENGDIYIKVSIIILIE